MRMRDRDKTAGEEERTGQSARRYPIFALPMIFKFFAERSRYPEAAEKYSSTLVTNQHLSPLLGDMKKPTRPRKSETTSPTAKKSVKDAESTTVSAKSTPQKASQN
jgi:hypothetical protein